MALRKPRMNLCQPSRLCSSPPSHFFSLILDSDMALSKERRVLSKRYPIIPATLYFIDEILRLREARQADHHTQKKRVRTPFITQTF
jgi:hypothetical protein